MLWQGLLPLMELSVCPLEGSREHAFQITGVWEHVVVLPVLTFPRDKATAVRLLSEPGC